MFAKELEALRIRIHIHIHIPTHTRGKTLTSQTIAGEFEVLATQFSIDVKNMGAE